MWQWLKAWWSGDHRRAIFRYWDGRNWKRADPLAVMATIEDRCPDFGDLLRVIAADPDDVPAGELRTQAIATHQAAVKKLLGVVQHAFGVKPLDQLGGLTHAEMIRLLTEFLHYMGRLAEAARPLPAPSPPGSHSPDPLATPSSAVCTSTGI